MRTVFLYSQMEQYSGMGQGFASNISAKVYVWKKGIQWKYRASFTAGKILRELQGSFGYEATFPNRSARQNWQRETNQLFQSILVTDGHGGDIRDKTRISNTCEGGCLILAVTHWGMDIWWWGPGELKLIIKDGFVHFHHRESFGGSNPSTQPVHWEICNWWQEQTEGIKTFDSEICKTWAASHG